jgi:hypothetical protein
MTTETEAALVIELERIRTAHLELLAELRSTEADARRAAEQAEDRRRAAEAALHDRIEDERRERDAVTRDLLKTRGG